MISKIDVSSLDSQFKLAKEALEENFDEAAKLMIKIGPKHDQLTADNYRDWPILQGFRASSQFKSAYSSVFNEPFEELEDAPTALKRMADKIEKTNID